MELLHARCAGLDVHAKTVVACVRLAAGGTVTYEHRTVSTTTRGLLELADWLTAHACTHVVLEATGVYWKPVWHVLEEHFALTLANPMHVRNIPGRKSDTKDATWLADLLAMGLIRSSFVPPPPVHALRDLTRTRKQLVRETSRHTQRIQKTLEDANVKLTEAISDILGTVSILTTMPGLRDTAVPVILAEIGDNMTPFPTVGHLVSWAGLCPRLDESAGKRRSTRTRMGAPWLKTTLVQAAWAATRKKDSYFTPSFSG